MIPCHTASLMVKLKVKHRVRLYVIVASLLFPPAGS